MWNCNSCTDFPKYTMKAKLYFRFCISFAVSDIKYFLKILKPRQSCPAPHLNFIVNFSEPFVWYKHGPEQFECVVSMNQSLTFALVEIKQKNTNSRKMLSSINTGTRVLGSDLSTKEFKYTDTQHRTCTHHNYLRVDNLLLWYNR